MNKKLVIFDIGSRDCMQSVELYKAFPNAHIYAFECNQATIPICRKNIEDYTDRITLIPKAVNSYSGTCTFHPIDQEKTVTTWVDGNPGASSLFKSNGQYSIETYIQNTVEVECTTLEDIIKEYNIDKVNIIWMDLQGAELIALKSMGEYMKQVDYIYTEVSHQPIYEGQVMFSELNDFILSSNFNLCNNLSMSGWQEDAIYRRKNMYDILVCIGPNDYSVISTFIQNLKQNVLNHNKIYIITQKSFIDEASDISGVKFIDEMIFPFSKKDIDLMFNTPERSGWYLQQLLKIYAAKIIPEILDLYVIIDSDVYFHKAINLFPTDVIQFNRGYEYHTPYFEHMNRLHPSLNKIHHFSGICHLMPMKRHIVESLISMVELHHGSIFWKKFLECISEDIFFLSGASEYEILFNFTLKNFTNESTIHGLEWRNCNRISEDYNGIYEACHWHSRDS